MRYIKLFEAFEGDLLEFTEEHLAYLMDDGFKVHVVEHDGNERTGFYKRIIILKLNDYFTWEQIKDRFLPYIYMLNKECLITEVTFINEKNQDIVRYSLSTNIQKLILGKKEEYLINKIYKTITITVK